jgi:N-carbamoyl-L-amino-acid hydrolase
MLGALVYVGGLSLETALDTIAIDGAVLGAELQRIGYDGSAPCPSVAPHAFVELHIEQGPRLEAEGVQIGAVTGVQGISWQEVTIMGQSNHAGTTPMSLRHDPAYIAAEITVFLRQIAQEYGGNQVCTVGKIDLQPNLINVVPKSATLTLDVRNTDENILQEVELKIAQKIKEISENEGVRVSSRVLARFEPVQFDERLIDLVETLARTHNRSVMRMPSGAGHDAQMLARVCPTSMIFTPSVEGISHNPAEFTSTDDLVAGANILLDAMWTLAHLDLPHLDIALQNGSK